MWGVIRRGVKSGKLVFVFGKLCGSVSGERGEWRERILGGGLRC